MSNSIFTKRLQTILVAGGILLGLVILFSVVMPSPFIGLRSTPITSRAENTAYNLKNAISAYNTEFRGWPIRSESDITVDSDSELMAVLLADDSETGEKGRNPRRITFFSGKKAKPMGDNKFRKGVHLETNTLWDPWGNFYRVRMDNNWDNRVDDPDPKSESKELPGTIIVWSAGPDGDFDTWKDNVKTW
ncbi:MAG: hypothetical protein ACKVJU_20390 [Verrucomicrobiales bacterium]